MLEGVAKRAVARVGCSRISSAASQKLAAGTCDQRSGDFIDALGSAHKLAYAVDCLLALG